MLCAAPQRNPLLEPTPGSAAVVAFRLPPPSISQFWEGYGKYGFKTIWLVSIDMRHLGHAFPVWCGGVGQGRWVGEWGGSQHTPAAPTSASNPCLGVRITWGRSPRPCPVAGSAACCPSLRRWQDSAEPERDVSSNFGQFQLHAGSDTEVCDVGGECGGCSAGL